MPMPMDQKFLADHLAQAERHVALGAKHIADQRHRIDRLARDGHDTNQAELLLKQFEELQALHVAERDRLGKMLGE